MREAQNLIGKPNGVKHLYRNNGNTHDIIQAIVYADKFCAPYTTKLAVSLRGRNLQETCYNIWKFWKENVQYVEDPDGYQFVKSPGYLYETAEGDCKSYSVAVASCLKNNNIPYFYRFITETTGKDYHHVYVVVPTPDGEIYLDCVLNEFNRQNAYAAKKDVRTQNKSASIGSVGATQAELVSESWEQHEAAFKARIPGLKQQVRDQGLREIEAKFSGKTVQKKKAKEAFEKYLDNMIMAHYCLIYLYWDNSVVPFPANDYYNDFTDFSGKRNTGATIRDEFKNFFGFSDNTVLKFAHLACYNAHGISMQYMLYRCYNMLKYGQPWEPVPGIPYFDIARNSFDILGGDTSSPQFFKQCLLLGSCFPAAGGIGRPYGTPYLSTVGYYIQNGCPDDVFKEWRRTYKGTTTELDRIEKAKYLISQNFTAEEPAARFTRAYTLYQQWRSGNMVALPNINLPKKSAAIGDGLGVGAIVAIIVACITAVSTIVGIVANIMNMAKGNVPAGPQMPNPPADFRMEYQTVDGCYIGVAPQECGNQKAKYCLDGTFTCLTEAQLNAPENQPGMPQDGFIGQGNGSIWLIFGGALLLLAALFGGSSKTSAA